jgi:hypothetical protein
MVLASVEPVMGCFDEDAGFMRQKDQITLEQLKADLGPQFEQLLQEVVQALNAAPPGAVIAASEEPVRDAVAAFRQKIYQRALQLKTDATAAAFSPSARPAGRKAKV